MDANALVVLSAAGRDSTALSDPAGQAAALVGDHVDAVAASLVEPWLAGGGSIMFPGDPSWPTGLAALGPAAPLMLWLRGSLPTQPADGVAIVGSRACTPYGRQAAADLAATAVDVQRWVVSGGAKGIDAAAHEGALAAGGRTVLVAAGGAGRIYPASHRELYINAARTGAVVWEFPATAPLRQAGFLTRNRLIAAMCATTVVAEARERSGALNTARTAADLGRLVLALPGPVTSAASGGCHRAIADGWGQIVLGTDDLRALLATVPA